MTTADRVDALLDRWAPTSVEVNRGYVGRHRLTGFRAAATLRRMLYLAKHRR